MYMHDITTNRIFLLLYCIYVKQMDSILLWVSKVMQ